MNTIAKNENLKKYIYISPFESSKFSWLFPSFLLVTQIATQPIHSNILLQDSNTVLLPSYWKSSLIFNSVLSFLQIF